MDLPSSLIIPDQTTPDRADRVLAICLAGDISRSALQRLISMGRVLVEGKPLRSSSRLGPGDRVEILADTVSRSDAADRQVPEFSLVFEDDEIVVVDKPPKLVVHPAAGCRSITLMEQLIETRPEIIGVGEPDRWGIVHRLDKDTSGVMVVAKTPAAHAALAVQFTQHSIHRIYVALVKGNPGRDQGLIDAPLGRHAKDRKRISTRTRKARSAVTHWRILERFHAAALLEIRPQTGRTHQIRVHLAAAGLPVVGDQVYGKPRRRTQRKALDLWMDIGQVLNRQALHARVLGFLHPVTGQYVEFDAPMPDDIVNAVRILERQEED